MQTKRLLTLFVVIILSSCKKGDTGPQGPAGPQGPIGPQGNANVTTVTVTTSSWYYDSPSYSYGADIIVSTITQSIIDNGAVLTYMSNGVGGWESLPFTVYPSTTYASTYVDVHFLNGVTIWKSDSDHLPLNPGTRTFKIVTIAGSIVRDNPNINWNNYGEVKANLNLKD